MMICRTVLLSIGLLMSVSSGWAMETKNYDRELEEIIETQNIKRLKELVPEINASDWKPWPDSIDLAVMAVCTANQELTGLILDINSIAEKALKSGLGMCHATENADMVKLLLARGMNPHAIGRVGTPITNVPDYLIPFFLAAPQFKSEALVTHELASTLEYLIKEKFLDPNLELNEKKDRPLHVLCQKDVWVGFPEGKWNMFIRNGADPELKNADGQTPRDLFLQKYSETKWLALTGIEKKAEAQPVQKIEVAPLVIEAEPAVVDNQALDCAKKMIRKKIRKKKIKQDIE